MAVNLNPGADATLVQAATNAAMANVPKDLSQMFQAQTENYRKTMESVGKSYSSAIETVGKVAGEAVKEAMHVKEMYARGASIESADTIGYFKDQIMRIKDGEKEMREMTWFSDERIAKRVDLEKRKENLFARIEKQEADIDNNIEAISTKDFDEGLTGVNDLTLARSINLMGEPIESGDQKGIYSRLHENKEGKTGWQMYGPKAGNFTADPTRTTDTLISRIDKDGTIVYADENNKASFVDERDISKLLKKRDIKTETAINAMKNGYISDGLKGKSYAGNETSITRSYSKVITRDNIGQLLDDGSGDDMSFNEKLNTPFTSLSMKAYASMKGITGLKDTDGVDGVSPGDFDISNEKGDNYVTNLANHALLRDAMDPKSDNFNFEATKEALSTELAQDSIEKNQIKFKEWEESQVLTNKLNENKLTSSNLTIAAQQERLNKLQNPADTPVDYFPSASKTGGSGVIFRGIGENFNPTKSGLISIREDIQNGNAFNLGNTASVAPDGKGGWNVQKFETLTKDMPDPDDESNIIPKGTVILSGDVVNYKTTEKLIVNALPRDFRQSMPEQYKTAEQIRALKLIEEAKNVNK